MFEPYAWERKGHVLFEEPDDPNMYTPLYTAHQCRVIKKSIIGLINIIKDEYPENDDRYLYAKEIEEHLNGSC